MRVAIQALAAVLGGTQILHTNSMDEALALPSEHAVTIALRTQQIIAHESGVTNTIDPLGGSYFVEALTDRMEQRGLRLLPQDRGAGRRDPRHREGLLPARDRRRRLPLPAGDRHPRRIIVGVNEYAEDAPIRIPILEMDPQGYERQVARLERVRRERDNERVGATLAALRDAAQGTENTMPFILDGVRAYATLGEIMDVFREVFGEYREPTII